MLRHRAAPAHLLAALERCDFLQLMGLSDTNGDWAAKLDISPLLDAACWGIGEAAWAAVDHVKQRWRYGEQN